MTRALFREDAYLRDCAARVLTVHAPAGEGQGAALELDATVCYPTGGGQPGDTGVLQLPDGRCLRVLDTRKGAHEEQILHLLEPGVVAPEAGTLLEARIDWERRHRHMRFHTALHLLCAAVPAPVTGGRMAEDKAHLDFDIEMDQLDKDLIEARINALAAGAHACSARWISDAELDANPQLVRTMSVAPPRGTGQVRLLEVAGVDLQPCGGTHVASTAEIGRLQVSRIRSEGKRNKRVTLVFAA